MPFKADICTGMTCDVRMCVGVCACIHVQYTCICVCVKLQNFQEYSYI